MSESASTATTDAQVWRDLWQEFRFGRTDAAGSEHVSTTQLLGALECTNQPLGTGESVIEQAVSAGILRPVYSTRASDGDSAGERFVVGYVLTGEA